jgi:hypothetical protein
MVQAESERLFKMFIDYAMLMNEARCYDVSIILYGFDKKVLSRYVPISQLARKWSSTIAEYMQVNPRAQSKLFEFY